MLSEDRWLLPEGIEEVLPAEAENLERLRRDVLDLFATWGYRQVITPFIEYMESLLTGAGHDLDLQTFKLIDQITGRLLGVRADMTPQVARIDARSGHGECPARFCYLGTVLHTQSDHLEKSRSPMQVGAELYGHAGIASDVEVIRLMLAMFSLAGLEDIHLDLGHVGIYRTLVTQAGLDAQAEAELFEILQCKSSPELSAFLATCGMSAELKEMFAALIGLDGDGQVLDRARDVLVKADRGVTQALDELQAIADRLNRRFPKLPIHFDLAELRGYHYKTGVVFAAFTEGYGREVARGGRYDGIGKVFGRDRPATGFSSDLKLLLRLGRYRDETQTSRRIFAPALDDPALDAKIVALRNSGSVVVEALPGRPGEPEESDYSHRLEKIHQVWEVVPIA